jgi:hypothetical protein
LVSARAVTAPTTSKDATTSAVAPKPKARTVAAATAARIEIAKPSSAIR